MQTNASSFDDLTKIRLLMVLLNDDGRTKLNKSLEKLSQRILETIETHKTHIINILTQA